MSRKPETVSKAFVYGTISFWLGKKADDQHSHKWICYVRGVNNEDLSTFIEKVVFTLHPSFRTPVRTVSTHPFEIHETGWGEFEIGIKIFFKEDYSKPIELFHMLKLYPLQANVAQSTKKPVVSENYEEFVFVNPSESFASLLRNPTIIPRDTKMDEETANTTPGPLGMSGSLADGADQMRDGSTATNRSGDLSLYYLKFDDKGHKQALEDALAYVKYEVESLKSRIEKVDSDIASLYNQVNDMKDSK
eukprot:TRINITY_DN7547_c0_g1_i6.p1 TRINITY_DN7547_c0_g1~~TRINITY_DN7547_c0_g1_i6.p1  ORF type:complete len:248 (+),score=30.01 TRINITY_DN7547_c0_g1_i6:69-812(+)